MMVKDQEQNMMFVTSRLLLYTALIAYVIICVIYLDAFSFLVLFFYHEPREK